MQAVIEFFMDLCLRDIPLSVGRIFAFIGISTLIIWVLWAILSKTKPFSNENLPKEFGLKLAFIWSLIFYYVIFSIYLFFFFKRNGIDAFQWGNPRFYLDFSSHLISIIAAIIVFLVKQFQLTKSLK